MTKTVGKFLRNHKIVKPNGFKIKSSLLNQELSFVVPANASPTLERAYILPINQEAEAEAFKRFIKENFR
jgi:hypothetical protein